MLIGDIRVFGLRSWECSVWYIWARLTNEVGMQYCATDGTVDHEIVDNDIVPVRGKTT